METKEFSANPEKEREKYSSIVILPYTSRIDKNGNIKISSHTALVLDAALDLFNKGSAPAIFIPGENTFGREYISTASLMKEWLLKRGVPEEKIVAADNLNNTEEQLNEVKRQGLENPLIVCLGFHKKRVQSLAKRMKIKGEIQEAEPIIIERHKANRKYFIVTEEGKREEKERLSRVSSERLSEFIGAKDRFPHGISKVYFAEAIGRTGETLGTPGRIIVRLFRKVMRAEGATVTDFHNVEPAAKHMERAIEENRAPEKLTA